ncbi:Morn repeat protein [Pandoravirus inopinatum]|uniref:Morn repeat protein n=1 Tax=Pandoravirus inopinatum TaxID=1605721 RepID=A0A0B5JA79_9VIRU|nr:Morn repeat protein [Pandoravirus inopinatum]AJF97806.1 Morn repeat protein [Pandoravirus inopinatum]
MILLFCFICFLFFCFPYYFLIGRSTSGALQFLPVGGGSAVGPLRHPAQRKARLCSMTQPRALCSKEYREAQQKDRQEKKRESKVMATLDSLPDELILYMLGVSKSIDVVGRLAMTSQRYFLLAADRAFWKQMCLLHYGPPLHEHFEASGKDWRWLYRAQSLKAPAVGSGVGGVIMRGRVYWGDTADGLPHGYGLGLCLPSRHRVRGAAVRKSRDPNVVIASSNVAVKPRYEGQWRNGLMHGYGRRLYKDYSQHEGLWEDDLPHGPGLRIDSRGWDYRGDWCRGQQHGHGVRTGRTTDTHQTAEQQHERWICRPMFLWANDRTYNGGIADGKPHGYGVCAWPDGEHYTGEYYAGNRHGYGTHVRPTGERYEGEYRDGYRHGYGVFTSPSGECYKGEWVDDKARGHGVYIWPDGACHRGEWYDSKRCGYGVSTWSSGSRHEGEWLDDKRHGHGVYVWPTGCRYEGEWLDDKRHGHGVSTWTAAGRHKHQQLRGCDSPMDPRTSVDAQQHNGIWHNNRAHGPGDLTYTDGSALRGVWCDSMLTEAKVARHCPESCTGDMCTCAAGRAAVIASHVSVPP